MNYAINRIRLSMLVIVGILLSLSALAQRPVKGVVRSKSGEPLAGATVTIKGTSTTVTTDAKGVFTLNAPTSNTWLEVSYVGYSKKEIRIDATAGVSGGEVSIRVELEDLAGDLSQVIVTGYGTTKKSDLISAVGSVSGKELNNFKAPSAALALQGQIPGVRVLTGTNQPGGQPTIYIRGVYTIQGSPNPLLVVDGIPLQSGYFNSINPLDIERMDVLKDASAAAIYGAEGANGVILITTKKGKAGQGNLALDVNYQVQSLKKPYTMAGSAEWLKMQRLSNPSLTIPITPTNQYDTLNSTDWWKTVINPSQPVLNANISYTGGSERAVYSMSLSYMSQDAQTKVGYWKRVTGRISGEFKVNDWLKIGGSIAPRYETWQNAPTDFLGIISTDPITQPRINTDLRHIPVAANPSLYDAEWSAYGTPYGGAGNGTPPPNYLFAMNISTLDLNQLYGLQSSAFGEVSILKGLTFRTTAGANVDNTTNSFFRPRYYLNPNNFSNLTSAGSGFDTKYNWLVSNVLTYRHTFHEKHALTLMAGQEASERKDYYGSGQRVSATTGNNELFRFADYLNMDLTNSQVQAALGAGPSGGIDNNYWVKQSGFFGRLEYNYNSTYYVTGSIRRDGNSKFPTDNQYAVFPSVSVGWRISSEQFMSSLTWMDNLMIKARYGQRGNAEPITRSTWYSLIATNASYAFAGSMAFGTIPTQVGNPNLKWETDIDRGFGFDASLFNHRFNVEFDYFNNKSKDAILTLPAVPWSAGLPNSPTANFASIGNIGWELNLGYTLSPSRNWRINPKLSLSHVVSKYLSLGTVEGLDVGVQDSYREQERFGMSFTRMYKNGVVGAFYGYQVAGIFASQTQIDAYTDKQGNKIQPLAKPGDFKYVDVNGDGQINTDGDRTFLGNPYPKLNADFSLQAAYKNFDLLVELYGSYGQKVANTAKRYLITGDRASNVIAGSYDKVWRPDNTNAPNPNPATGNNYNFSSWYVEDGSFTRIRNIQVGYTLPATVVKGIKSLRLYAGVQNIATITGYKGFNPEVQSNSQQYQGVDRAQYPVPRIVSFGATIGL